ncbi:MAG: shikimate dehydrogenase [Gemmatimonadota bacterium]
MSESPHISASTRLITLLGDPVAHSLSPQLHNAAFRALALDAVYVALRCSSSDCGALLRAIARSGGAGNVTAPHKEQAAAAVEVPSDAVRGTGACNTFWLENDRVAGDNTDVEGFRRALHAFAGDVAAARVLLLGAGGAASAVVAALAGERVTRVDIIARNQERLGQLSARAAQWGIELKPTDRIKQPVDLIINATPLGFHEEDALPYPLENLAPGTAIMDLVYRTDETAWVRRARENGMRAIDGKEMLLQQAAASFERWWPLPAPRDAMRRALWSRPS